MTGFDIAHKHVGDGAPCLIVAEVAQAHEGSLGMAHAFVDAVATAGADAIKFQLHIAHAESTPAEPWRIQPRWPQDVNRYGYWQRMEFSYEQWEGLAQHAKERGLIFLCSPFSVEAVHLIDPFVPAWKIASGEVTNLALIQAIAQTNKPALVSGGMSTYLELNDAIAFLNWAGIPTIAMQCTSLYPCPPEKIGLYRGMQGLSDHSGTIWPSIAAVALGAHVVEVHIKLSSHDQGFDAAASITPEQLRQMVEGIRFVEQAQTLVDKDELARELAPMRTLFMGKSIRKEAYDRERIATL